MTTRRTHSTRRAPHPRPRGPLQHVPAGRPRCGAAGVVLCWAGEPGAAAGPLPGAGPPPAARPRPGRALGGHRRPLLRPDRPRPRRRRPLVRRARPPPLPRLRPARRPPGWRPPWRSPSGSTPRATRCCASWTGRAWPGAASPAKASAGARGVTVLAVVHLVLVAAYAGFQWTVRALVYPQFAEVPTGFAAYERAHQQRITRVVGPLFLGQGVTTTWLLVLAVRGDAPGPAGAGRGAVPRRRPRGHRAGRRPAAPGAGRRLGRRDPPPAAPGGLPPGRRGVGGSCWPPGWLLLG